MAPLTYPKGAALGQLNNEVGRCGRWDVRSDQCDRDTRRGVPRDEHDRAVPEVDDVAGTCGECAGGGGERCERAGAGSFVAAGDRWGGQACDLEQRGRSRCRGARSYLRPGFVVAESDGARSELRHGGEGCLAAVEQAGAAVSFVPGGAGERGDAGAEGGGLWTVPASGRAWAGDGGRCDCGVFCCGDRNGAGLDGSRAVRESYRAGYRPRSL